MPDDFNPYHKWLGIPLNQQPADHYRLLGIVRGEGDPDVITHATEQRTLYLKSLSGGEHGELSRLLLDEIYRACHCLLDKEQKTTYDKLLETKQNTSSFPDPPSFHSSVSTKLLSVDDGVNRIHDAEQLRPNTEEDNSAPLAINIDTGNAQRKKKNWERFDDQLDDLSEKRSSAPDFIGISATGSDEQNLEGSPAISPMTENAESFPAPPPLPPEKNSVHAPFAQQNPFDIADDSEDELANGVTFSNAPSTGTPEPKRDYAKSTRKKERRIQLIGHIVAPIMGLIIGWIILQYLKTK